MSASRHPQNITKNLWYYEYPNRIEIVYQCLMCDRTEIVSIPMHRLVRSLKRCKGKAVKG